MSSHVVAALLAGRSHAKKRVKIPPAATRRAAFREPVTLIGSYAKWIRGLMRELQADIIKALQPALAAMRLDALPVKAVQAFGNIELHFADLLDERSLKKRVADTAVQADKLNAAQFKRLLKNVAIPPDRNQHAAFIEQNIKLIKSLGHEQIGKARDIIEAAALNGERPEAISETLVEQFGIAESRADLIARDQLLKLQGDLTRDRQTGLGITGYIWTTSGDERVRDYHVDLDGTVQSWDNPPLVSKDGRHEHPGRDFQCRCVAFPVLEELGDLADALSYRDNPLDS